MTRIQWTEKTWNPVRGCSRVSPGCDHCYAMGQAHRFSGPGKPYEGLTTLRRGKVDWAGAARFVPEQLDVPLRVRRPTTWFVNSMSDLFHHSLTNEQIAAVFGVMAACPQHTFQVLTKRADRLAAWFARDVDHATECGEEAARVTGDSFASFSFGAGGVWPLPNVWLGCSVEDRARKDRIDILRTVPAAVRFLSLEPLLEDLGYLDLTGISWVIVGGESGNGARPCNVAWIRSIVTQCKAARVPCFVKQLGARIRGDVTGFESAIHRWIAPDGSRGLAPLIGPYVGLRPGPEFDFALCHNKGGDITEWPDDLRVREMPEVRA